MNDVITDREASRLAIGGNKPPSDAEILRDKLLGEAEPITRAAKELIGLADAIPEEIADEETASLTADLIKDMTSHLKTVEATREAKKAPFLEGGRVVDAVFKGVADPLDKAKRAVNRRLTLWQQKVAEAERRAREEEARKAREEEERVRREAEEKAAKARAEAEAAARAEREAREKADREAAARAAAEKAAKRREAEAAEKEAQRAAAQTVRTERAAGAKDADLSRQRGALGATASLRTVWDFRDLDRETLDLEALRHHLPMDGIEKAVRSFIRAGGRSLRGVEIIETTDTVVK